MAVAHPIKYLEKLEKHKKKTPHKHKWQFVSFGGDRHVETATFVCECGEVKLIS